MVGPSCDIETASVPFVGLWNRLISRTNWEKGRIICQWREALIAAGASAADYSDDAWAARIGGVSGQHVGRLRRVYLRFSEVHEGYDGLYWSHFFAALDWPDAEMWLEGAVQNAWSVSQMRGKRWETIGSPDERMPCDENTQLHDLDEDMAEPPAGAAVGMSKSSAVSGIIEPVEPATVEEGDPRDTSSEVKSASPLETPTSAPSAREHAVRPFADLPEMPDDLAEAFEQFKIAILNHKLHGWQRIACEDLLAILDALKMFALAPPGDE